MMCLLSHSLVHICKGLELLMPLYQQGLGVDFSFFSPFLLLLFFKCDKPLNLSKLLVRDAIYLCCNYFVRLEKKSRISNGSVLIALCSSPHKMRLGFDAL